MGAVIQSPLQTPSCWHAGLAELQHRLLITLLSVVI